MSTRAYITRHGTRYEEVAPGALYEPFVEALVISHAEAIFPSYIARPCQPYFTTPHGNVKPDLVLVARDYSTWAVVEVELEEHSASGHVQPQIGKLAHASINDRALRSILGAFASDVPRERLREVLFERPHVYLVTHGNTPVSAENLRLLGVDSLNIRIFRGGANDYLLHVLDRRQRLRSLMEPLRRSSSPVTRNIWTLKCGSIAEIDRAGPSVVVELDGRLSSWAFSRTDDGYLFRMPSSFEVSVDFVCAEVAVSLDEPRLVITKGR